MGHVDNSLRENEKVIYRTGPHWAILGFPAILLFLAGMSISTKGVPAVILFSIASAWGILSSVVLRNNEFVITNERLLIWTVFPWKKLKDVAYTDIKKTAFYQPTLGKLLDFGTITIVLSGGKKATYRLVSAPHELLMRVEELVELSRQTSEESPGDNLN